MSWYYEKDGQQQGPVSEQALRGLLSSGEVTPTNLIWTQGMSDWKAYSEIFPEQAASGTKSTLTLRQRQTHAEPVSETTGEAGDDWVDCPTCGARVRRSELIPIGDTFVCPNCRDAYMQSLREGVVPGRSDQRRGTGGATSNGELRRIARENLSGK